MTEAKTTVNKSYNYTLVMIKDYTQGKITFKAGYRYDYWRVNEHKHFLKGTGELCHTEWVDTYPLDTLVKIPRDCYKLFRNDYVETIVTTKESTCTEL